MFPKQVHHFVLRVTLQRLGRLFAVQHFGKEGQLLLRCYKSLISNWEAPRLPVEDFSKTWCASFYKALFND